MAHTSNGLTNITIRFKCPIIPKINCSFLSDLRSYFTTNTTVYVSEGMSTVLNCQVDITGFFYWRKLGYYILTDRLDINPKFSNKLKIVGNLTNGEYNMQIYNATEKDGGIYECNHRHIKTLEYHETVVALILQGNYSSNCQ